MFGYIYIDVKNNDLMIHYFHSDKFILRFNVPLESLRDKGGVCGMYYFRAWVEYQSVWGASGAREGWKQEEEEVEDIRRHSKTFKDMLLENRKKERRIENERGACEVGGHDTLREFGASGGGG